MFQELLKERIVLLISGTDKTEGARKQTANVLSHEHQYFLFFQMTLPTETSLKFKREVKKGAQKTMGMGNGERYKAALFFFLPSPPLLQNPIPHKKIFKDSSGFSEKSPLKERRSYPK